MEPLDFLAVVLPSPGNGWYCAAELTKKKEHTYKENISDLQPEIDRWHANKCDVFYALGVFKEAGNREAENVAYLRSFFIDMDGYASKKDAAQALDGFMQKVGLDKLGQPWIVASGGGLHVYWPLTDNVSVISWKPVAENLKRLCKQEGLAIDMNVTADAARVLRVPGTTNFKKKYETPRPVKLMLTGDRFDFDAFKDCINGQLREEYAAPRITDIAGTRPKRAPDAASIKMLENSLTKFELLRPHCAQVTDYEANAQDDGKEPIWRGLLSWTKVCADGDEWSVKLSDMHPYPAQRMQQKLAEIKGPYPCTKMDSENPGICGKCPHWGKVTNPLVLGRELLVDNTEKVIELKPKKPVQQAAQEDFDADEYFAPDEEIEDILTEVDNAPKVVRPQPPRGFSFGANGGVYANISEEDAEGKKTTKNVQLLPYDLFVVDLLKTEQDHLVHMAAVRPNGVETLNFPQKSVVSKDETLKWLASNNIVCSFMGYDKRLYEYVRSSVGEASQNKKAIEVPTQCGWQPDGSFVYNYRVFTPDGRETAIPMPGLENINRSTNSSGTLEEWREVWDVFKAREMHTLLAVALDTFGAPLMRFTEYEGFVWHIGSRWSGTGKSLTLSAKAGVWGHPIHYRTGKGTSPVAMQQRAGLLNSLPLLIDEITSAQRKDMEWAPNFIFDFAEGKGKERMENGANKERVNNTVWASTCTMTSNELLSDFMAGARKFSSNGELLRMLEWTPNVKLTWTREEAEVLKKLKHNYGVAGEAWVRWMVRNQDIIPDVVRMVHKRLKEKFHFTDDERYWHAGCTTTISAALMISSGSFRGRPYAGILDVAIEPLLHALKEIIDKARGVIKHNVRTAEDVLNAYIRDNYGGFIVIKKVEGKILAQWSDGDTVDKSITRTKVLGRVEHGISRPGYRDFFIEEGLLKQHCVNMNFGYTDFRDQLAAVFAVSFIKKDMLARTSGPNMRVNVMHICRPEDDLDASDLPVDEPKAG